MIRVAPDRPEGRGVCGCVRGLGGSAARRHGGVAARRCPAPPHHHVRAWAWPHGLAGCGVRGAPLRDMLAGCLARAMGRAGPDRTRDCTQLPAPSRPGLQGAEPRGLLCAMLRCAPRTHARTHAPRRVRACGREAAGQDRPARSGSAAGQRGVAGEVLVGRGGEILPARRQPIKGLRELVEACTLPTVNGVGMVQLACSSWRPAPCPR